MNPILTRLLAAKAEATLIAATMTRDPYEGTNKDECSQWGQHAVRKFGAANLSMMGSGLRYH